MKTFKELLESSVKQKETLTVYIEVIKNSARRMEPKKFKEATHVATREKLTSDRIAPLTLPKVQKALDGKNMTYTATSDGVPIYNIIVKKL